MPFFVFNDPARFFGEPAPAPGVLVRFVPEKMFAARERRSGRPVERRLVGDEGLVVHDSAVDVIMWPSSLWRVTDLEQPVRSRFGSTSAWCQAFTVVEQVPAWLVAGPNGHAVEWVINQARALTSEQVAALAAMSAEDERLLTRALWDGWRQKHCNGSPVGCGTTALNLAFHEAARRVGPELFSWDEDDGIEVLSDPSWQTAWSAANAAALALGAPEWLTPEQNTMLAYRWTRVFGKPPG